MTKTSLENRIRAAYVDERCDPPANGFEEVLRRRDGDEHIELSVARKQVRTRFWIAAAAASAAWVAYSGRGDDPLTSPAFSTQHSVFFPDLLIAQAAENRSPASDSFAIRSVDGSLLKPGTWIYRRRPIGGPAGRPEWDDSVTILRGSFAVDTAWLLINTRGNPSAGGSQVAWTDTTWVRKRDLWPLARSTRLSTGSTLRWTFMPDSTLVVFEGDGRTRTGKAGGISSGDGVGVTGQVGLPALFKLVPLSPAWRGSFRVIGINNADEKVDFVLSLRVNGSEAITVPAGTFDCWKVSLVEAEPEYAFWVSKREHWIVKSGLDSDGIKSPTSEERVLVSVLSGER